jgi:hypothetical protein
MISSAGLRQAATPAASAPAGGHSFRLQIGTMTLFLALAVLAVVAASFSAALSLIALDITRAELSPDLDQLSKLTKFLLKFDVGGEQTVAAWLSSMLMLLCAVALCCLAAMKRQLGQPYAMHWLGLSVVFLGLSMDEAVGFHEMTVLPMREMLHTGGVFLFAWVIPALLFVVALGIVYLGFLLHLEPAVRLRLVLAAGLFVGGSIGFEMLEGALAGYYQQHQLLYEVAVHLEDTLEFAGLLLFLHSLLVYARAQSRELRLHLV